MELEQHHPQFSLSQVPKEYMDEFLSVRKFNIFNTNNLWINLRALQARVKTMTLEMDVIVNRKTLKNGARVIQLEEAAGAAIKSFDKPMGKFSWILITK